MNANILKTAIAALALLVAFNSCKEETKFHIEVTCDPERGTVTGTGDYAEGEEFTVTATANPGYYFVRWNGIGVKDSVGVFKASRDITITAIFGKIGSNQFGTVKIYETRGGDSTIYEAIPNENCYFVGWSNKSKKNPETLSIDADPITADFIKIDNSNNKNGSVVAVIEPNKHWTNDPYVQAVPADGYYFWKWSDGSIKEKREVPANTEVSLTPIFKTYPEGSIHAVFYVSETKRVIFSKGNLQFNPTMGTHIRADGTTAPGTWRFAENQYDVTYDDSIVSATYDGWIDSFAWGTSGWSGSGATYYQPYDGVMGSEGDTLGAQYGPKGNYDLTGDYAYADWGVYNPISNGGNKPGMWRTLTYDEFYCFAYEKHRADLFYNGSPWGFFFNQNKKSFLSNEEMWSEDEVFKRETVSKHNDMVFLKRCSDYGCYWTTSGCEGVENEDYASPLSTDYLCTSHYIQWNYNRSCRFPVRLVMDVEE